MQKIVLGSLAIAGAAALTLGFAQADTRGAGLMGGMERPTFAELDSDGDGSISIAEMKARSTARFAESDTDGDGKLTAEEMTAAVAARAAERMASRMAQMIEWRDTDGDGALSEAEMPGDSGQRMFMMLDADEDGAISAEEFSAIEDRGRMGRFGDEREHRRGEYRGDRGHGGGHGMFGGHGMYGDRG